MLLQQFEESKNRTGKFSLRATEEFCQVYEFSVVLETKMLLNQYYVGAGCVDDFGLYLTFFE